MKCEGGCSERLIFYHKNKLLKTLTGITDLNPSVFHGAYYECNKIIHPSQTSTIEVDDPDPRNYMVGDTILWEFFDARLCLVNDGNDCESIIPMLDLPYFSLEYVITPEDFECE